jgi:hypothetical protein
MTMTKAGFIASEALSIPFVEPENLSFLESSVQVQRETNDNTTTYTATFDHPPLEAPGLMSFLGRVAPNPTGDTIFGVIGDWAILDDGPQDDMDTRLAKMHEVLNRPWLEFKESQPAFIDPLRASVEPHFTRQGTVPPSFDNIDTLTNNVVQGQMSYARRRLLAKLSTSYDTAEASLEAYGIENVETRLFAIVKDSVNNKRRLALTNIERIRNSATPSDIETGVKKLFPKELLTSLTEETFDELFGTYVAPNGTRYRYMREMYPYSDEDMRAVLENPRTMREGLYEAEVIELQRNGFVLTDWVSGRTRLGGEYFPYTLVVPGSPKKVLDAVTVEPIVSWQVNEAGERTFVFPRDSERTPQHIRYRDGILGALAVAYLSPKITQTWPRTMKIGRSKDQAMGVAQIPVLGIMPRFAKQLLESNFIAMAERVAE